MEKQRLIYLWDRYRADAATPEEQQELQQALNADENRELFLTVMEDQLLLFKDPDFDFSPHEELAGNLLAIDKQTETTPIDRPVWSRFTGNWSRVAASLLLLVGAAAYLWTTHKKETPPATGMERPANKAPEKNAIVLTLADGSQVLLDSLGEGVIASQTGSKAVLRDGELVYRPTAGENGEMVYNTVTTPKGRQFILLLPDGTKVWLNAASFIRYPTAFGPQERKVEISGEAYFEVAKNRELPFRVKINEKAIVEVLGTRFNINAYANEQSINTTLLEGSVRIVEGEKSVALKPGEQAQVTDTMLVIPKADINKVMAWKNGLIHFDGASFEEIMRQVERWYDIDVIYENNNIPDKRLGGEMTRDVPLDDLLKQLGEMGVRYRLEGRRLTVLQ